MAKKTKKSKTISDRPKISPYARSPTTVLFGIDRQRYYVQDALLQQLKNCPVLSPWTFEMVFEDVDADTAHTLIHFLYTGVYQTLDRTDDEDAEADEKFVAISEFQKAARVSEAASKYRLPALQHLAESEMDRRGASMDLDDAIHAISKDSVAKCLDGSIWLQEYVSQKVRSAFQVNPEAFLGQDFFERISSHTLTKILAKIVVSLYSGLVSDLQKERMADEKASPSENEGRPSNGMQYHTQRAVSDRSARNSETWPEYAEKLAAMDGPSVAGDSRILVNITSSTPEVDAWESPPTIADHADDATRVEAPTFTLTDAITVHMVPESVDTLRISSDTRAEELKVDEAVLPDSEVSVLQPSTELPANLRKAEENLAIGLAEDAFDIAADGAEKRQDDCDWGVFDFGAGSSKKKTKKKSLIFSSDAPVLATAEAQLRPERAAEHVLAEAEPEPVVTAETEKDNWGVGWGEGWGAAKKKKKKGKREATYEPPPLEPEPAPDAELRVLDATIKDADEPKLTTQTVVSEIEDCPWRLGHVLGGDGWKTCKPCQAHIRGLAANLQAADL